MRRKYQRRFRGPFPCIASTAASFRIAVGALLAALLIASMPSPVQATTHCPEGDDYDPEPTSVAVTAVPIVVASTTDDYFVLYARFDIDGTSLEMPVLVKNGESGTTTLAENVPALPAERYRVEKYLIADPADVDGDCTDDITELGDPVGMNPVNPAAAIGISDGAVVISDTQTYDAVAVGGYFKFGLIGIDTDRPSVYFINTKTHPTHQTFLDDRSINRQRIILGAIAYSQNLVAPDGSQGGYHYSFNTLPYRHSFSLMERAHTLLAASMPLFEGNLALYVRNRQLPDIQPDLPLYRESRINLLFDRNVYSGIDFLASNPGVGYGLLQVLDPDGRPHPRNIVIYEALPNELPRVAGIITTVPQTPLSHVNLRAVQDGIPNAFIRDGLDHDEIEALIGSYVRYEVAKDGHSVRAATKEEVDAHYEASRPQPQTPERDLSVTEITPLNEIGFDDWRAFGVKAANVAVLGTLDFPEGTVPDGFAIPFYFYDEFMRANGFHDRIEQMLADEDFQTDFGEQDDRLDDLRDDIEDADSPQWILDALTAMHAEFLAGQSLRYRSSTNNEDLPGFNGAGLYDSKTQDPEETAADGIDKSLKGVFASLWTFRAFTEREFHRIDHLAAMMGVLVHPNYKDELVNGVAASFDPIHGWEETYYVNSQLGEDLVTNPVAHSLPEEGLLSPSRGYSVLSTSNLVPRGQLLMSAAQLEQLEQHLTTIHDHFEALYTPGPEEPFAMEIEFKITSENILAIKQARPWVFAPAIASDTVGAISFSTSQPRINTPLTATLTDPDGVSGAVAWTWHSSPNGTNAWAPINGAAAASYTPITADLDNYLRATASYTDGFGPNRSAQVASANPVQGAPPPRRGGGGGSRRPPEPELAIPTFTHSIEVVDSLPVKAPNNPNLDHNIPDLLVTLEDGREVMADFLTHYNLTGQRERWGYPTSEVLVLEDGTLTQFYQRGVVDFHNLGSGWVVERRLAWDYVGGGVAGSTDQGTESDHLNPHPGTRLGPWGHKVSNLAIDGTDVGFADFFDALGGVSAFGLPKSDAREDVDLPGRLHAPERTYGFIRQYFQAGVLEFHPNDEVTPVKLTLLGDALRDQLVPGHGEHPPFNAAPELVIGDEYLPYSVPEAV